MACNPGHFLSWTCTPTTFFVTSVLVVTWDTQVFQKHTFFTITLDYFLNCNKVMLLTVWVALNQMCSKCVSNRPDQIVLNNVPVFWCSSGNLSKVIVTPEPSCVRLARCLENKHINHKLTITDLPWVEWPIVPKQNHSPSWQKERFPSCGRLLYWVNCSAQSCHSNLVHANFLVRLSKHFLSENNTHCQTIP